MRNARAHGAAAFRGIRGGSFGIFTRCEDDSKLIVSRPKELQRELSRLASPVVYDTNAAADEQQWTTRRNSQELPSREAPIPSTMADESQEILQTVPGRERVGPKAETDTAKSNSSRKGECARDVCQKET